MKKLLCVLLALLILFPVAAAADENRFAFCSLDELYQIRKELNSEIMSRYSWEEVTVPAGFYVVGEDIPAGHWTISFSPGTYAQIEYFKETDETGKQVRNALVNYYYQMLCDPENEMSSVSKIQEIDLELKEGYYFVVHYYPVIFKPYTGRPSPFTK